MKKIILMIAASLFTVAILTAADQPVQPNPFDRYDKDLKKLEERKAKLSTDDKIKKSVANEIKKVQDQKDKALKKLTAPFEKEKSSLNADIEKAKAKDKNADLTAKQAKLDYQDKMIEYFKDLSSGKTAEMPKEPGKTTADEGKTATATDKAPDKKTADTKEK